MLNVIVRLTKKVIRIERAFDRDPAVIPKLRDISGHLDSRHIRRDGADSIL